MSIRGKPLPWGMQRAGLGTKLMAKNRRHEKDHIVYCFAAKKGVAMGFCKKLKVCKLRNTWEESFHKWPL